jgi:hypothetical protein
MVREKVLYVFEEVFIVFRDSRHLSPPIAVLSVEVPTSQSVEVEHPNNNMQCLFSITGPSGSSFLLEATDSTFSTPQPIPHLLQGVLILAK